MVAEAATKVEDEVKAAKKAEDTATSTARVRANDSRSPPPSKAFAKGGSSSSSTSKPDQPQNVIDALAKQPRERNDEETLLAASAAKASRKQNESWADATDAQMEGNDVEGDATPQQ